MSHLLGQALMAHFGPEPLMTGTATNNMHPQNSARKLSGHQRHPSYEKSTTAGVHEISRHTMCSVQREVSSTLVIVHRSNRNQCDTSNH